MEKQTTKAFGKTIYLLGIDNEGTKYWLEEPSWDCDWYWGFGYIETYTNNDNPSMARDITSHSHFKSMFIDGKGCIYDNFKNFFKETTLSDNEIWLLCDYMKSFYTLREMAELMHNGCSWQTEKAKLDLLNDKELENKINKVMMAALFEKIKELFVKE